MAKAKKLSTEVKALSLLDLSDAVRKLADENKRTLAEAGLDTTFAKLVKRMATIANRTATKLDRERKAEERKAKAKKRLADSILKMQAKIAELG
jgi:hypothetical protein